MKKLSKKNILIEKVSGNYSCPHYIPPKIANVIAESMDMNLDTEAAKTLAEVAENFASEILKHCKNKSPNKSEIRSIIESSILD
jgi:hypothetical protein